MSQEMVEIVRAAIDPFNRRDLQAWEALSHPDVEVERITVLRARLSKSGPGYLGPEWRGPRRLRALTRGSPDERMAH